MPGAVAFVRNRGTVKPQVPRHHWKDLKSHEQFFNYLAEKLSIKTPEQWYNVSLKDIENHGGGGLMHMFYGKSLYKALSTVFPTHNWLPWRFNKVPKNFWNDEQNVVAYLQWVQKHLGINTMSDWRTIPRDLLSINLLKRYGGLIPMLKRYFPDHSWNVPDGPKSKSQSILYKQITYLFPNDTKLSDYNHPSLTYDATNKEMQLDVFLPQHNLAFEYQGQSHYSFYPIYGSHTNLSRRDSEKKIACAAIGITLIEVPFWWDRTTSSLQATIFKYRPDLLAGQRIKGNAIEEKVPSSFRSKMLKDSSRYKLREILKPLRPTWDTVQKSFGDANSDLNVKGWYFSQKIRGYRCYWDGDQLLRANGTKINIPEELKTVFPNEPLDILLCTQNPNDSYLVGCQGAVELQNSLKKGNFTIYAVDLPSYGHLPFKQRKEFLKRMISGANDNNSNWIPQLKVVEFGVCDTLNELKDSLGKSPHGLVLYKPDGACHEPSSQMHLWTRREEKAIILSQLPDGLLCKLPEGQEMEVKTSVKAPVSSVVTVSFSDNNMKDVRLEQLRPDVDWEEINKSTFPYTVSLGKGIPKCRGCGREIKDRTELRIQVRGTFTPLSRTPFPVKYSMCLNLFCVKKALQMAGRGGKTGVYLPPFENQIGIPSYMKATLDKDGIPPLENVIWKYV